MTLEISRHNGRLRYLVKFSFPSAFQCPIKVAFQVVCTFKLNVEEND